MNWNLLKYLYFQLEKLEIRSLVVLSGQFGVVTKGNEISLHFCTN